MLLIFKSIFRHI